MGTFDGIKYTQGYKRMLNLSRVKVGTSDVNNDPYEKP